METAMLEAGPRLVMEAATGIIKQTTVLLSRSAAVGKTTGTFLEWAQENREKLDVFAQSLVKLLIPCFKKKKKGGKAWRENLWRIFQTVRISTTLETVWKTLPDGVNSKDPMFCQMMLTSVMEGLRCTLDNSSGSTSEELALSELEQKALRYVAGYVPVQLRKKLERSSHPLKEEFILCLWDMCEDDR